MKKLVHTREISMRTFDLGGHYILVEGSLIDHRYQSRGNKASEQSELVHPMVIRLKVRGPGMLIKQARANMPHHPREECPEVLPWMRNLEGLKIAPGYSLKVKKVIGGIPPEWKSVRLRNCAAWFLLSFSQPHLISNIF